jgi:hypothetical protein
MIEKTATGTQRTTKEVAMKRNLTYLFICAIIIGATAAQASADLGITNGSNNNKKITSGAASYTNTTLSATNTTKTADESSTTEDATADDNVIEGVTRPGDDETDPAVWAKYFKDALAAIKNMSSDADKKAAWEQISGDMLKLSKENPDRITAGAINQVMSEMTAVLKEKYRDSSTTIDVSKAQADLVNAALNFAKSDAFGDMEAAQQSGVIAHFTNLAVETSWRSEFNTANKDLYAKIGEFFKTTMESDDAEVKSQAFIILCTFTASIPGAPPKAIRTSPTTSLKKRSRSKAVSKAY